eukprot:CAMPEP_0196735558 /NCGR_PEP_ID=MMETSP1091-20130531/13961_1 /TAXON_ID=302021 /ORGANISM="Rhodomonas sp., Strain CCMP768" /LENGTH=109 /DNA_ID=CAMNT_0042079209 /DNA_START=119 /DNA_END=449 /DNA_ORIENTATION=-
MNSETSGQRDCNIGASVGSKFGAARWDDRNPFATVEMFRHVHKPDYQETPLHSIHKQNGIGASWDDRNPFLTAKMYQLIRPIEIDDRTGSGLSLWTEESPGGRNSEGEV